MNDVLKLAEDRRRELRQEIAEMDDFIRMAQSLVRNAKTKTEQKPDAAEEPEHAEDLDRAEEEDAAEFADSHGSAASSESEQVLELPAAEAEPATQAPATEPVTRRFPWTNAQPAVRKSDADDHGGPVRHNLMRREAS